MIDSTLWWLVLTKKSHRNLGHNTWGILQQSKSTSAEVKSTTSVSIGSMVNLSGTVWRVSQNLLSITELRLN